MTTKRRARKAAKPRQKPDREATAKQNAASPPDDVLVVGLGASAGGLEALSSFFDVLPGDTGMAFVSIQHLDPSHESMMVPLLANHTAMKVLEAATDVPVESDRVYIIPPGAYLSIREGVFHLSKPRERQGARMPFDVFLRSLADDCGSHAICAVLSGNGTDGSEGLLAVHANGGLVMAQDPSDAGHDGMPRSAINTGAVDLVLPVTQMPAALIKYRDQVRRTVDPAKPESGKRADTDLQQIVALLRKRTPHDFSQYREGTLLRQIERRMAVMSIKDVGDYLAMLRKNSDEIKHLAKWLLINVTQFFRDENAFKVLTETVIPELIAQQPVGRPLRVWDAGCSTGEETYSIVMLLLEEISAARRNVKLQVFASDADSEAVAAARDGLYPESINQVVSPERLERFFVKDDCGYRVTREMREAVVFTTHDLLADPPLSGLDFVSCRNVLIYLRPEAQDRVLGLFHFALREGGYLIIGASEAIGGLAEHFTPIARKLRIFRHTGISRPGQVQFPTALAKGAQMKYSPLRARSHQSLRVNAAEIAQQALLAAHAPSSVLIDSNYKALYFFGPIERYLKLVAGDFNQDIFALVDKRLRTTLRTVVRRVQREQTPIAANGKLSDPHDNAVTVRISAQPVHAEGAEFILISFAEESTLAVGSMKEIEAADMPQVAKLELELDVARKELELAISDLEIANDELMSNNEEAMSVNEELQAANEELETSKEELQSFNEELTALNSQLNETVEQLRATADDLRNMMNSSDVAMLFLDTDFNIRLFTPAATSMFNIIPSDVNRPLADLAPLTNDSSLIADARTALTGHISPNREVEGCGGMWYIRRILPYRSNDDQIRGVVITFADITERKNAEGAVEAARIYSNSIIDTLREPLVVLDEQLRVMSASAAFYRFFSVDPEETVGRTLEAIDDGCLDIQELKRFLDRVRLGDDGVNNLEFSIELPSLGLRSLEVRTKEIIEAPTRTILLTFDDRTEHDKARKALEASKHRAEQANLGKSRFLAAASHDLRQPLQTLTLLQGILAKRIKETKSSALITRFDETLGAMTGMLNTLLDINQLEAGIVVAEKAEFDVDTLLQPLKTEFAYHAAAKNLEWRVVSSHRRVCSDPRLLAQMLRNLLANAVKYTDRGKVLLGCRRRGDKLSLEVWDTGIGIAPAQMKAIFEEFHQINNDSRESRLGLGLGLSIVQRIGDLMGHAINVRSRLDYGSVFTIEVPLVDQNDLAELESAQDEAGMIASTAASILIIEDDPAVREMLEILFEGEGHKTLVASGTTEALALAARAKIPPDVIVADYNLPGDMTGVEVVTLLRESLRRHIPGIILTGDISTKALRRIFKAECVYLSKPASADELTRHIQWSLEAKQAPKADAIAHRLEIQDGGPQPTVFIIDDDRVLLDSMKNFLQAHGHTVEVYASGTAFLDIDWQDQIGCLVVDAVMPGIDGIALLKRLKTDERMLPAIMITGHGDLPMAVQAMKAGAIDFLEKPVRLEQLLTIIDKAFELASDSAKLLAAHRMSAERLARLTPRQREVLELVIHGRPNKIIAYELGISQRSVESHRAAGMKRAEVASLPDLVRLFMTAE